MVWAGRSSGEVCGRREDSLEGVVAKTGGKELVERDDTRAPIWRGFFAEKVLTV